MEKNQLYISVFKTKGIEKWLNRSFSFYVEKDKFQALETSDSVFHVGFFAMSILDILIVLVTQFPWLQSLTFVLGEDVV